MNRIVQASFLVFLVVFGLIAYRSYRVDSGSLQTGVVVVNVLDPDTYYDCHIPGSVNITLDSLSHEYCRALIAADSEVIVYCSNYQCSTSSYVAKKLKEYGYSRVRVYEGGAAEWFQEGYPVVGPCKQGYLSKKVPKPIDDIESDVKKITLQELASKMKVTNKTVAA